MSEQQVSFEQIETFLEGRDPQKYIVSIEAPYHRNEVYLIINDPEKGKSIETHNYKPFVWMKHDVSEHMFNGNKSSIKNGLKKYGLKIKTLKIDNNGVVPERLEDGYKYMITCDGPFTNIINFVRDGFKHLETDESEKCDLYSNKVIPDTDMEIRSLFVAFTPAEQFFIQTGKRLFKGMDDYNDVHRLQFDLETEGLNPSVDPIFQVGVRDNKGYEEVLEVRSEIEDEINRLGIEPNDEQRQAIIQQKRDSERIQIARMFQIIDELKPDVITAYNSENFDWPYIERRCERLSIDITEIAITLNSNSKFRRKASRLKIGSESEAFNQTLMWGYNIIDISHCVRKTMAINSNIKSWSLKYITKFSKVAKVNRVYVDGDKIHKIWKDNRDYWFNNEDGTYGLLEGSEFETTPFDGMETVKGDYIVQRYLLDDLWETEQVDGIYNQAAYLVAKILPTSFMRSSTMGTAGQWKLIMAAWSYEQGLGIPKTTPKRDFTGGLARLLEVGYAENVDKFDYAALYPKTQLTWDIFPDLDISGVMKGLLTYVVDTRDEFKFKAGASKKRYKELEEILETRGDLTPEVIEKTKAAIEKHKRLASDYDKKQLPLKILANSFFGAYGAPYLFNWGDSDCAEETTCRGRQSLRLMVKEFKGKHQFRPLVGDTDGFNFARPDSVNSYTYLAKGDHWKTEGKAGIELKGVDAVLAEFNETHMEGRMGLDLDDVCSSTINFARKNYANAIDGKVKLVGNTVKSNKMPIYIEEFLDTGIKMLLDGDGYKFINYYYDYVDKIYNYQIPLMKIASKGKIKKSVDAYKKKMKTKNKSGGSMARQAHMELVIANKVNVTLGDVIYYVNIGEAKSHGDLKTVTDKETGKKSIELNCKLISTEQIEQNPDLTTDEYNVARYIDAFNKRIRPLLVCFSPDIRYREEEIKSGKNKGLTKTVDNILVSVVKVKEPKVKGEKIKTRLMLEPRKEFTEGQCKLDSGNSYDEDDQDTYADLMTMEDKEIRFWTSVNKVPNYIDVDEWKEIVIDYHNRKAQERKDGIQNEKDRLDAIFQTLEVKELGDIESYAELPILVVAISDIHVEDGTNYLRSKKWDENLCLFDDLWKYESDAIEREKYYQLNGISDNKDRFDEWLDHKLSDEFLHGSSTGETIGNVTDIIGKDTAINTIDVKDVIKPIKKIGKNQIDFEGMTGMEGEGELQSKEIEEELDKKVHDMVEECIEKEEEEEDEWGF